MRRNYGHLMILPLEVLGRCPSALERQRHTVRPMETNMSVLKEASCSQHGKMTDEEAKEPVQKCASSGAEGISPE